MISIKIKNGEETAYSLNETKPLETFFAHTFTLKANKDPEHTENYYSTFFTNEYAYKVPTMAKAYEGDVESGDDADVLKLSNVGGVIPQGEAVILKATDSSIEFLPSARRLDASSENDLEGTDKGKDPRRQPVRPLTRTGRRGLLSVGRQVNRCQQGVPDTAFYGKGTDIRL